MGDTIWVDVEGRAQKDLPSDNSIMLRLDKHLGRLAARLGVAKLTEFYDYSEMESAFGDLANDNLDNEDDGWDEIEADEAAQPAAAQGAASTKGAWFDPAPALRAVRAIRDHLTHHPADLGFTPDASRAHWPAMLMEELEHCHGELERAASAGKRFRFLIVP